MQYLILVTLLSLFSISISADAPFYPKYPTRNLQVLDGQWSFGYSDTADPMDVNPSTVQTPDTTIVPGCMDIAPPGVLGRRGTAFYRTQITTTANTPLLFYFTACSFYCSVFVDEVNIGEHRAGGYQPFWLTAPASSNAKRTILVVVNNKFNATTAPTHLSGDFWMYGGITRSVIVHEQPADTYLLQVETFTIDWKAGLINSRILYGGKNITSASLSLVWDNGTPTKPMPVPVSNQISLLEHLSVPNPTPWSLESPKLHTLQVNLLDSSDKIIDSILVRFGIRGLSIVKNPAGGLYRLALNDNIVKLHGVNRHTMWPDTGSALTLQQITTDVNLLKSLGANYVRGAHYPQDPRFLDMCDENGIAIWEETLGPGVKTRYLEDPYFMKYQIIAVNEMISASINHPSVIFYAFYNEGPSSDPKACPGYNASASAIRERVGNPPTRLVTWASDKKEFDVCLAIADVISFNNYPAWYDHPNDLDYINTYWVNETQWVIDHYPQKPLTISETGAGAIYEWTNSTDPMWSQGYQAEVLQRDAMFAITNNSLSGISVWQFADIKINDRDTQACGQCVYEPHPPSLSVPWTCASINSSCTRPGGENHKGVVDFWRRPKAGFTTLQSIYTKK